MSLSKRMVTAAENLIAKYKDIICQIENHTINKEIMPYQYMHEIGFGQVNKCVLCLAAMPINIHFDIDLVECGLCLWGNSNAGFNMEMMFGTPCSNVNYYEIKKCSDYEELKTLLKVRIKLIKNKLNKQTLECWE